MSAESTPVLSGTIASFEIFMTKWEELHDQYPRLRHWLDNSLKWAQKYYQWMDDTDAYIETMSKSFLLFHLDADWHIFAPLSPQPVHSFHVGRRCVGSRLHQACERYHYKTRKWLYHLDLMLKLSLDVRIPLLPIYRQYLPCVFSRCHSCNTTQNFSVLKGLGLLQRRNPLQAQQQGD